eukprot:scaffold153_cov314-Prasinococcus_capsulatus_cf.AAC.5
MAGCSGRTPHSCARWEGSAHRRGTFPPPSTHPPTHSLATPTRALTPFKRSADCVRPTIAGARPPMDGWMDGWMDGPRAGEMRTYRAGGAGRRQEPKRAITHTIP